MAKIISSNGLTELEELAIEIDSFESMLTVKDKPVSVTGRYAYVEATGDKGDYQKVLLEVEIDEIRFFMDVNGEVCINDILRIMTALKEKGDKLGSINIIIKEVDSKENSGQSYNKAFIR